MRDSSGSLFPFLIQYLKSMNCNNTSVKDFFGCAAKAFWLQDWMTCETRVCYLNMVLNHLFLDTYMLDANLNVALFDWDWLKEMTTLKPILQIENFYGIGRSNSFNNEERSCDSCDPCGMTEHVIEMFEVWPNPWLKWCQFNKRCKTIKANIPKWVTSWYVKYFAWFNKITSEDDIMPVDDDLFPALNMLLAYYTNPITADANQQERMLYFQNYNEYIKKYLDQYSKRPGRSVYFHWV